MSNRLFYCLENLSECRKEGMIFLFSLLFANVLIIAYFFFKRTNNPRDRNRIVQNERNRANNRNVNVNVNGNGNGNRNRNRNVRNNLQSIQTMNKRANSPLKRALQGVHRVTVSTNGSILRINDGGLLEKTKGKETIKLSSLYDSNNPIEILPEAVEVLKELASVSDLYLITTLPKGQEDLQKFVMIAFENISLFDRGFKKIKCLFCTTVEGNSSMVRQLEPQLHIETNSKLAITLKKFLPRIVSISSKTNGSSFVKVFK
ncbi:peroxisome biogenesis protein [Anaeramoeba flamelloides]|uniref:Peroxisome biogenesis protein n=1 Tax=Anaeramoeba flamelloides TaxID=1746091 RepID=A0AAV7YW84_9EUKA|nr:peroxisome biogenesis protein [Anaeramoeba flamelloides]